jgi:hypothetical protein
VVVNKERESDVATLVLTNQHAARDQPCGMCGKGEGRSLVRNRGGGGGDEVDRDVLREQQWTVVGRRQSGRRDVGSVMGVGHMSSAE